jgi:multiple antibiotic resistance protein
MMVEIIQAIPFGFAALFPIVNPIASSAVFASVTQTSSANEKNALAFKIALFAAVFLIAVLISGSFILRIFGVTTPVLLIGGGLVIAYMGWRLLNQNANADVQATMTHRSINFMAINPSCIVVAIALSAHTIARSWEATLINQIGSAIGITLVCVTIFLCYKHMDTIAEKLNKSGADNTVRTVALIEMIMRIAAFINLCVGLQLIAHGMFYFIGGLSS